MPDRAKQQWNCGFLPRLPGPKQLPSAHGGPEPSDQTCPGYLVQLPGVYEGLAAHLWWEKGQLAQFIVGERTGPHLHTHVEVVAGAVAELEVERAAEQQRKR